MPRFAQPAAGVAVFPDAVATSIVGLHSECGIADMQLHKPVRGIVDA